MRGRLMAACVSVATLLGGLLPAAPADAVVDKIGFGFPASSMATVQGAKLTYSSSSRTTR